MEIEIKGRTINDFIVSIDNETFNISELLIIDENNLDSEIDHAAAQGHFWSQIAIDAVNESEIFEKTKYVLFKAHCERFARYYLKGLGEKTLTVGGKDNAAILIFSSDGKNFKKEEHVKIAYLGYSEECKRIGVSPLTSVAFCDDMFMYDPTFEDAEAMLLSLKHKANQLKAIAHAFAEKSWGLKSRAADIRASKNSNI